MDRREQLQELLEMILGSENVYFQPPNNLIMTYPCIRYERDYSSVSFADNKGYRRTKRYLVTHIDRVPDSPVPDLIEELPMCTFNRHYVAENLNHNVYNLYF